MKIIKGRKFTALLLGILCTILLTCMVFVTPKSQTAKASTGPIDITPTTLDGTSTPFSGEALLELYDSLMGLNYTNAGSYNKLEKWLDQTASANSKTGVSTPALTYTQLGDISVTFGDMEWQVVYLTKDRNGDVVATLWLNDIDGTSVYCSGGGYSLSGSYQNQSGVYATSFLASQTLGNGGLYYNYNSSNNSAVAPTPAASYPAGNGNFAKFAAGDLSGYIDTPSLIDYQETESSQQAGVWTSYYIPNESYGTSSSTAPVGGDLRYLSSAVGTGDWADDKVWIPSLAETGCNSSGYGSGIWDTGHSSIMTASGNYWSRSGTYCHMHHAISITSSGGYYKATYDGLNTASKNGVRPAVHLNLKKADDAADYHFVNTPSNIEFTYDGIDYKNLGNVIGRVQDGMVKSPTDATAVTGTYVTFTDVNGDNKSTIKWYDYVWSEMSGAGSAANSAINFSIEYKQVGKTSYSTLTEFEVIGAGEYKITCNLSSARYKWRDMSSGGFSTDAKTFTITVNQKEIKYKWANTGGMSGSAWSTTFNADTFTPASGASAAPWLYPDYTLPVASDVSGLGALTYDPATDTASSDTIPCIILKFVNTEGYDADIDKILAKGSTPGTNYPKEAGTYTVSFIDKNANTSNYKLVADSGEGTSKQYTIERQKVTAPGVLAAKEYGGNLQEFTVNNFNAKYMDYGEWNGSVFTQGVLPAGMTADTTSGLKLKAREVDGYKVAYQLKTSSVNNSATPIVRNYEWQTNATGSGVHEITYKVEPKKLGLDFISSAGTWSIKTNNTTDKLTYVYLTGKGPADLYTFDGTDWVVDAGGTKEEPVLEIYFYWNGDTNAADNAQRAAANTELKFSELQNLANERKTGNYTVVVKLADSTANPVNKNYVFVDGDNDYPHEKTVELKAGEASLNDILIQYKDSTMSATDDAVDFPATGNLKYTWDVNSNTVVEYMPELNFKDISFLQMVGVPSYHYSDGTSPASGHGFSKAGTMTVTVNVQIWKDTDINKMPTEAQYNAGTDNKFTYTRISDTEGQLTFTFTIDKGTVDIDVNNLPLEYSLDGKQSWKTYSATNLPEYTGGYIYIRIKKPYPNGLNDAEIVVGEKWTNIGTVSAVVSFDIDTANYVAIADKSFQWEISPEIIDVDWGWMNYYDANGNYFQVRVLNYAKPEYAAVIEYQFYNVVNADTGDLSIGAPVGTVEALSVGQLHNALEMLCPTASSTMQVPVWVKAVIKPGVTNYVLRDTSTDATDPENCAKRFKLGDNKDMVRVTLNATDVTYNDAKLSVQDIISLDKLNANNDVIGALEENNYTLTVYAGSDKYNMDNNTLIGALSDWDSSAADAGSYVIKIELITDASGEVPYALSTPAILLEIKPKGIEVPTLGEIVFTGSELNFEDYLGGIWETYKDIITVSGKISDRNVGATDYITTLTLNSANYTWIYPSATPAPTKALLKYALASGGAAVTGDDTVATYTWNISPLIVDTANMWNKGKSGATLNLPENIKSFIDGETLTVGYRYYDGASGEYIETPEIKGGRSFKVEAVFGGFDAENGNIVFKTGDNEVGSVSNAVDYTVPQSGAAAFFGNALSFVKSHWLWFVIALAILLFLIILIVIIAKRRKNKEERQAKKEAKEEEKRRREEEREAEKRKREQELELEKAKQEAELAKMKAQMGLGAGAAGLAMAMQQPAQAQQQMLPQQQQQYQQMPMPQPMMQQSLSKDNDILAKIEAELAVMREDQRAIRNELNARGTSVYGGSPAHDGDYRTALAEERARVAEARLAEERARVAEEKLFRATEERAMLAEERFVRGGANTPAQLPAVMPEITAQSHGQYGNGGMSADFLGAAIAAALRSNAQQPVAPAQPAVNTVYEDVSQPVKAQYPADAVITTTTTVDTTKNLKPALRSDDGRLFDVDGFYDAFDENR